jgi:hypothetical protein
MDFNEDLKYAYTSKKFLKVLEGVSQLIDSGANFNATSGERWNMFLTGQTVFTGKGLATFENMAKANNKKIEANDGSAVAGSVPVEYVVMPVPTTDGAKPAWLSSHGTNLIIYIAALLAIPNDYFEAAEIDGATFYQKIFKIVLPMVKPTTLFLFVTGVIKSFQVFMNAYMMTGGGPDNNTTMVGLLIFNNAFKYSEFGKASAQALVLAAVIAIISLLQFKFFGNEVEY